MSDLILDEDRWAVLALVLVIFLGSCASQPAVEGEAPGHTQYYDLCTDLKHDSDSAVASCREMCPDREDQCVRESCLTKPIKRWIENRSACAYDYPTNYYPNPSFPKVSLLVD